MKDLNKLKEQAFKDYCKNLEYTPRFDATFDAGWDACEKAMKEKEEKPTKQKIIMH